MNNNPGMFTNVLKGINSTLNIVNKAIPIYREAKPIINTVTKTYKKVKDNGTDIKKIIKLINLKNELKKEQNNNINITNTKTNTTYSNINNPSFFI